jgi:hypothetical protein
MKISFNFGSKGQTYWTMEKRIGFQALMSYYFHIELMTSSEIENSCLPRRINITDFQEYWSVLKICTLCSAPDIMQAVYKYI